MNYVIYGMMATLFVIAMALIGMGFGILKFDDEKFAGVICSVLIVLYFVGLIAGAFAFAYPNS